MERSSPFIYAERLDRMAVVVADLFEVASLVDLVIRLEKAWARHTPHRLRDAVGKALAGAEVGLSLGGTGFTVALAERPNTDPLPALHTLLDLPNRLVGQKDHAARRSGRDTRHVVGDHVRGLAAHRRGGAHSSRRPDAGRAEGAARRRGARHTYAAVATARPAHLQVGRCGRAGLVIGHRRVTSAWRRAAGPSP